MEDIASERVGIEGGGLRDGVIVAGRAYGRQGLDHQPSGLVGVFEGELAALGISRDKRGQIDRCRTRLVLGDGHRHRHAFLTGQKRQIVLFAIGEILATDGHLTDKERIIPIEH